MKRTDMYLQAPTQDALQADLEALGYVQDEEIRLPSGCAHILPEGVTLVPAVMDAQGNEITPAVMLDGVVILIRCTEIVAAILSGATWRHSAIVEYRQGFPAFGGCASPPGAAVRARRAAILGELDAIDLASVRPLRAQAAGTATAEDVDRLAALEAQAASLRDELAALG